MKCSLIAHNALMDLSPEIMRWVEPANYIAPVFTGEGEYYTSKDLEKSSVGKRYAEIMPTFAKAIKDIIPAIEDHLANPPQKICSSLSPVMDDDAIASEVHRLIFKFMPLGTMAEHKYPSLNEEGARILNQQMAGGDRRLYDCALHTLTEVRELTKDLTGGMDPAGIEYHATQRQSIERLAVSLCTGYGTKDDVPQVQLLSNDANQLEDIMIAAILYPWAIQPAVQLRMLAPALPATTRKRILEAYVGKRPDSFTMPGPELDFVGNSLTFDVVADFPTYINMRRRFARVKNVRQAWTPWLGFDIPSVLGGLEAKYMEQLKGLIDRSFMLCRHIQETGLTYESQYAVLAGFRGRFMLTGSLSNYAQLIEYLSGSGRSRLCQKTAQRMYKKLTQLVNAPWFDSLIFSDGSKPGCIS